jgi:hypothetical protein
MYIDVSCNQAFFLCFFRKGSNATNRLEQVKLVLVELAVLLNANDVTKETETNPTTIDSKTILSICMSHLIIQMFFYQHRVRDFQWSTKSAVGDQSDQQAEEKRSAIRGPPNIL